MNGRGLVLALAGTLVLTGAVACQTQEQSFYARTFPCTVAAGNNQCGTTQAGKPMVCYAGSQLGGGSDFCTEACDPAEPRDDSRWRCMTSGALLQTCKPGTPGAGDSDPSGGCPPGLSCYRTNLLLDEGVCLMMTVCNAGGSDCKDSTHTTCAADILHGVSPLFLGNNLQCVKPTCLSEAASYCPENESCLAKYYTVGTSVPDMCVPNCADGLCPPGFACARTPRTPGAPEVCLPGLPGLRCQADQDCAVGTCVATGAGFNECALSYHCSSDTDCAYLDGLATFVCAEGVPGAGRYCIATAPFNGADCADSSQCFDEEQCYRYSPYEVNQGHGECRLRCDNPDHSCPARGGIPHVCLDDGGGGCFPGLLGLPCTRSSDCVSEFACLPAPPDVRSLITSPMICTTTCTSDLDCTSNPLILNLGFCQDGLCRLTGAPQEPCERDGQCAHGLCSIDGNGGGTCAD